MGYHKCYSNTTNTATRMPAIANIHSTRRSEFMIEENLKELEMDGYCILKNIIPDEEIDGVRESLVTAQTRRNEQSKAEMEKTRARGHRIGTQGVGVLNQVINETQSFAPYVADRRIKETVEAVFGPHARISCTDCVVNLPGNQRGYLHADWPYNATNASHIPPPYPDVLLHLSSLWMLSPFTPETGGTIVVPGSHKSNNNPAAGGMSNVDRDSPYPGELQVTGRPGSVMLYDSRLWHAVAPNCSDQPRVALRIRYAPWWLNLNPSMIGTPEHSSMVVDTGGKNYDCPPVKRDVYESLPAAVKPLYRHYVS